MIPLQRQVRLRLGQNRVHSVHKGKVMQLDLPRDRFASVLFLMVWYGLEDAEKRKNARMLACGSVK